MESSVRESTKPDLLTNSNAEYRGSSCNRTSYKTSTEEVKAKGSSEQSKSKVSKENKKEKKPHLPESKSEKLNRAKTPEVDMMKERFAKLLLGEDMSGSGKGVCTAMAISNAITNLGATIFGQLWSLEPLPAEKKTMWQREMGYLLCVCDHIVEFAPSWQTFPEGNKMEVMTCRPRSDLFINLPALRQLDNMLLKILDSFTNTEFWYVDQGIIAPDSFRKTMRQEEKWWLPVPRVPPGGLNENSRRQLQYTRECTSQVLKAAMATNSSALAEMKVPQSYLEALPKTAKACLGDVVYRYITSDQFSSEYLLDCLDLSSEHVALEIANRLEASVYMYRQRSYIKNQMVDGDKREFLAERAESLLVYLKQRFPTLTQTTLDTTKIQCNKDVGKSILESYSRVLESLAVNIIGRIDEVLDVDDLNQNSDRLSSVPKVSLAAYKKASFPYAMPPLSIPSKRASFTPSPVRGEITPFLKNNDKSRRRGWGIKRVLITLALIRKVSSGAVQ